MPWVYQDVNLGTGFHSLFPIVGSKKNKLMEWNMISCLRNSKETTWYLITYRYWAFCHWFLFCLFFPLFSFFLFLFLSRCIFKLEFAWRQYTIIGPEGIIQKNHLERTILCTESIFPIYLTWIQIKHQTFDSGLFLNWL